MNLVAALLAGAAFVLALRQLLRVRRRQGLSRFARLHGMRFSRSGDGAIPAYRVFGPGDGRPVANVVEGDWHGVAVRAADVRLGRRRRSVAEAAARGPASAVSVRPRGTPGGAFRLRDIELESNQDFRRRFAVDGDDLPAVLRLAGPSFIQGLQALPDEWGVEFAASGALVHGPLVRPEDTALVLDMAVRMAGLTGGAVGAGEIQEPGPG